MLIIRNTAAYIAKREPSCFELSATEEEAENKANCTSLQSQLTTKSPEWKNIWQHYVFMPYANFYCKAIRVYGTMNEEG